MHSLEAPDPLRKRLTFSYLPMATSKSFTTHLPFSTEAHLFHLCLGHLLTSLLLLHIHQIIWHLLYWCHFPTESHCHSGQPPQLWNMIPLRICVSSFTGPCLPQLWWVVFLITTVAPWILDLELLPFHHCRLQYGVSFSDSSLLCFQLLLSFPLVFCNLIDLFVPLTFNDLI